MMKTLLSLVLLSSTALTNFAFSSDLDKCSKDNSCSDEIKKQYESCNGNFTCSNELINEYDECFPTIEEENPNTIGLNIILITLASVGSAGVGYTAYVKRKKLKQF